MSTSQLLNSTLNTVSKTYGTLRSISDFLTSSSTPANDQKTLTHLLRRLECIVEPLNLLMAWTSTKNSAVSNVVVQAGDVVEEVRKFVHDYYQGKVSDCTTQCDKLMRELDFVISAMSMAINLIRMYEGSEPQVGFVAHSGTRSRRFVAQVSWSALMRASAMIESSRSVRWAQVCKVRASLYVLRETQAGGETSLERRNWQLLFPKAVARVVRTSGRDSQHGKYYYELQVVKTMSASSGGGGSGSSGGGSGGGSSGSSSGASGGAKSMEGDPEYASFALNRSFVLDDTARDHWAQVLATVQAPQRRSNTTTTVTTTQAADADELEPVGENAVSDALVLETPAEGDAQTNGSGSSSGAENKQDGETTATAASASASSSWQGQVEMEVKETVGEANSASGAKPSSQLLYNGSLNWWACTLNDTMLMDSTRRPRRYALVFHHDDGEAQTLTVNQRQSSIREVQLYEESEQGDLLKYRSTRHRSSSSMGGEEEHEDQVTEHGEQADEKDSVGVREGANDEIDSDDDDDSDNDSDSDDGTPVASSSMYKTGKKEDQLSLALKSRMRRHPSNDVESVQQTQLGDVDTLVPMVRPVRRLKVNQVDLEHIILLCLFESQNDRSHLDASDEELWWHFRTSPRHSTVGTHPTAGAGQHSRMRSNSNGSSSSSSSSSGGGSRTSGGDSGKPPSGAARQIHPGLVVPVSPGGVVQVTDALEISEEYAGGAGAQ